MSKFSLLQNPTGNYNPTTSANVHEHSEEIAQIKGEIERLNLIAEAMWNLLTEKGFTDEDLVKAITEIDNAKKQRKKTLEEGGKVDTHLCPYCHVPLQNNGKLADRCIYCGHEIITSPFKN
ncbi:MAG: hypothetical protein J5379_07445 [Clostridiales bacterium]|nr:hypothetical protein [Clostridiales bacterium]